MTNAPDLAPDPVPDFAPSPVARPGVGLFLAIAFGWSWAVGAVIWKTGAMGKPLLFTALAVVFMAGPAVGALAAALVHDRGRRIAALGLAPRFNLWLVWAWAIPLSLIAAAMLIDWAGPAVSPASPAAQMEAMLRATGQDPTAVPIPLSLLAAIQIGSAVLLAPALNLPIMLTEELGWRGFLWDRWRRWGFWPSNLAIGAVWGAWHAPLIALGYNYPGMPVLGPVLMVAVSALLAPLIGLVRERGGSVWHACLFHGTINATAGVGMMLLSSGAGFPWMGLLGIGGAGAMAAGCELIALFSRRPARISAAS